MPVAHVKIETVTHSPIKPIFICKGQCGSCLSKICLLI